MSGWLLGFSMALLTLIHPALAGEGALSRNLRPRFSPSYYAAESDKYFDTLESRSDPRSRPEYAPRVIRWVWHPWLLLTGYKKSMMRLDWLLTLYPTQVIDRVCEGFSVQPFGRCHVTFVYRGKIDQPVHIYEEFTFNDEGQMTFIEAWTDVWSRDEWGESPLFHRLSTRVPGLGRSDGRVDPGSQEFLAAAAADPELYDLLRRLRHPVYFWLKELRRFLGSNQEVAQEGAFPSLEGSLEPGFNNPLISEY